VIKSRREISARDWNPETFKSSALKAFVIAAKRIDEKAKGAFVSESALHI